jgi:hypothetical protein
VNERLLEAGDHPHPSAIGWLLLVGMAVLLIGTVWLHIYTRRLRKRARSGDTGAELQQNRVGIGSAVFLGLVFIALQGLEKDDPHKPLDLAVTIFVVVALEVLYVATARRRMRRVRAGVVRPKPQFPRAALVAFYAVVLVAALLGLSSVHAVESHSVVVQIGAAVGPLLVVSVVFQWLSKRVGWVKGSSPSSG